jgi:HipA-like protein
MTNQLFVLLDGREVGTIHYKNARLSFLYTDAWRADPNVSPLSLAMQAELDWFVRQPTLSAAIENAALARNSRGQRYSHQRRIKRRAIQESFSLLSGVSDRIKRSRDFDELFQPISAVLEDVPGIGELYIYDTSLRIGEGWR